MGAYNRQLRLTPSSTWGEDFLPNPASRYDMQRDDPDVFTISRVLEVLSSVQVRTETGIRRPGTTILRPPIGGQK